MSGALGLGPPAAAAYPGRSRTSQAQLLVVDPEVAAGTLTSELAALGVQVTAVASTIDGLVEFGRDHPAAVIVAPDAPGVPPCEFVKAIRRFGSPFVIAVLDTGNDGQLGELILAGGSAAIERPYTARDVWGILENARHAFPESARLRFGPLELDTRAYVVRIDGERIQDLPHKEFELLRTLMLRAPDVLSDQEIRGELWAGGQLNGNTLAVHVARLRHRLRGAARIRRVRGLGYSLALD